MTITITSCSTGKGIGYAEVQDIYGNVQYADAYGNLQVLPGNDANLLGTLIEVSASGYDPNEFTISSDGTNSFCLTPTPPSTGGSGGIYSL